MRAGLYPKLAWDGIRKNKRFYLPYILTCIGMVMMFYIIHYLAAMPTLDDMPGGRTMTMVLGFGFWIVALFAVIFLFYTNSFLMRRRQKEFGLYNMLGMGKRHLSIVLFWENLILFAISMVGGLASGILLSKMAELCLVMVLNGDVDYSLYINRDAFVDTWIIFVPIFVLIFVKSLIKIRKSSAVALIKSENVGEKPPRANYLFGIAGIVILGIAYYIALSIENPLIAMAWFFIAVCLVIVGTYLLFISGSVMLCKLLQKKKRYYYKKNHFVSVSSMTYRMKRNGAGLASICILSTMVLVMMMGAGSLYFGKEDSLNIRYSHDINASVDFLSAGEEHLYTYEKETFFLSRVDEVLENYSVEPQNVEQVLSSTVTGMLKDGRLILDRRMVNSADTETMDDVAQIILIPLSSYNRNFDAQETLDENEVIIQCIRRTYNEDTITLSDGTVWNVKKKIEDVISSGDAAMSMIPSVFVITNDIGKAFESFNSELDDISEEYLCRLELSYAFDADISDEAKIELGTAIEGAARDMQISGEGDFYSYNVECREKERADYYGLFGGIFFLGIFLSIIFLAATVLIIYYKQVTEGYEDESRFNIMRKVGMTTKDIRKNINSQMLTVFFLPLITAALHVGFAFPMVQKLLAMFNLRNTMLSLIVTGAAIVIFGIFYAIVYRVTSNAYYTIVSGRKEQPG
ncbi:MAG: ABC transporter permease [Roseburia sp.]|nr:ABC transporter permease [Roseburia sp.]